MVALTDAYARFWKKTNHDNTFDADVDFLPTENISEYMHDVENG